MSFLNEKNFDFVMASAVLLVLAIPVGIANIYLGYVIGEGPCTLCWWERIGMVVVGDFVYRPEAWISVIDAVKAWCGRDEIRQEIYRRRYKLGESYKTSCWDLHIAQSTYHFVLTEIRNYAFACAAQAQVIRVF